MLYQTFIGSISIITSIDAHSTVIRSRSAIKHVDAIIYAIAQLPFTTNQELMKLFGDIMRVYFETISGQLRAIDIEMDLLKRTSILRALLVEEEAAAEIERDHPQQYQR